MFYLPEGDAKAAHDALSAIRLCLRHQTISPQEAEDWRRLAMTRIGEGLH